jgi:hypothetical protein
MSDLPTVPPVTPLANQAVATQPYYVAILLNDTVQQTMNVDGQLAALLLSNPTFVQCDKTITAGMVYNQNSGSWVSPTA